MDNGCPICQGLTEKYFIRYGLEPPDVLCIDCQIEQADADALRAMNRLEELKKKKEKQNELNSQTGRIH